MSVLGLGIDLVTVSDFADQMKVPGTAMPGESFTPGELQYCASKGSDPRSFAVRWAAKEAVLKAWASSRFARSPQLDDNPYLSIEVVNDAWGRPSIALHGQVKEYLSRVRIHLSLTHDGDTAAAVAILEDTADLEDAVRESADS